MATSKDPKQYRFEIMDLRPTKKRITYSLLIVIFISIVFLIIHRVRYGEPIFEHLFPKEFNLIYLTPMLIFIATYFIIEWLVTWDSKEGLF